MKKIIPILLLFSFLSSCIGEDFIEREVLFPERIKIITNSTAAADTLFVGDSIELQVEYRNSEAKYENVRASWTSSNPEYAAINTSSTQLIGLKKGVTRLRASYNGLATERLVVVVNAERVELVVNQPAVTVGDSLMLSARYFNVGPQQNPTFTYSVSNSTLAEINGNRLIGKQQGKVELIATANGIDSDPMSISIVSDTTSPATIDITSATLSIMQGDSLQFTATVKNINGTVLPNSMVSWSSSNASILSIDNDGKSYGSALGSSDVIASAGNAQSATSTVLVNPVVITSRTGTFQSLGSYTVSGSVTMNTNSDGTLRLDFSNFSSSSGPGLYIYLGNSVNSGITIEKLDSRSGTFTAQLPSNIELSDYNNVLIWCQPFGVAFGSAVLN